jgi:hypothetical protein
MVMRCALVTSLCLASLLAACAPEGTSAYVSENVPIDSSCEVALGDNKYVAVGSYDIAGSTTMRSPYCQKSYYTHLLVNSNLKANARSATGRAEPNVLQVTEAEISLFDIEQDGIIPFSKGLPNPFRVKANITVPPTSSDDPTQGEVPVETIPLGYASQLDDYVGKQILAEITLFGTTIGDVDIDFRPFSFPIYICQGCMTRCLSDFGPMATKQDVYGDNCDDNAGADGRICVIPSGGGCSASGAK